jgi:HSP20 family protein
MNLVRFDPFNELDTVFSQLVGRPARWPRLSLERNGAKPEWSPSADISETDAEYVIRAELPAVQKEDVQVTLDEGTITIKGERKQHKEDKNEKYHRIENFHGTFERSFSLPENINAEAVRCDSKDGILTVHIPKKQTPRAKPIQISVQ